MKKFRYYTEYKQYLEEEMIVRSRKYLEEISIRRTVREFSDKNVPKEVIENCIKAAATAPSGANQQPWTFVAINNIKLKKIIQKKAEEEEREFYEHRASEDWLKALEPFDTNSYKPFLETAPWLIPIFVQKYGISTNNRRIKYYYTVESVGIATGILINALNHCGLATLTHTPSPMNFLNEILDRPKNEKTFLLLVVGYPKEGVQVPDISKKPLNKILKFV